MTRKPVADVADATNLTGSLHALTERYAVQLGEADCRGRGRLHAQPFGSVQDERWLIVADAQRAFDADAIAGQRDAALGQQSFHHGAIGRHPQFPAGIPYAK
ncbi:MAG: hypothetical protein KatS3mg052_1529 [Candidatus Roseilinea sp.]|nr:MAG: hypothetical protein KatS3mg052_1529 [Candidatus Roseilinea sp.]